jgi:hypothetical protein
MEQDVLQKQQDVQPRVARVVRMGDMEGIIKSVHKPKSLFHDFLFCTMIIGALSLATGCFSCSTTTRTSPGTVGSAPQGSSSTTTTTTNP